MSTLQAVPVEPVRLRESEVKHGNEESLSRRHKKASKELDALLKIRMGKSRKAE